MLLFVTSSVKRALVIERGRGVTRSCRSARLSGADGRICSVCASLTCNFLDADSVVGARPDWLPRCEQLAFRGSPRSHAMTAGGACLARHARHLMTPGRSAQQSNDLIRENRRGSVGQPGSRRIRRGPAGIESEVTAVSVSGYSSLLMGFVAVASARTTRTWMSCRCRARRRSARSGWWRSSHR